MNRLPFLILVALVAASPAMAQSAAPFLGDWVVPNEDTGEPEAVIRLSASGSEVEGRVVRVYASPDNPSASYECEGCHGEYDGRDLRRIRLLYDLAPSGGRLRGGRFFDPESGRTYRCELSIDGAGRLRVRIYAGVRALGATETWTRAR